MPLPDNRLTDPQAPTAPPPPCDPLRAERLARLARLRPVGAPEPEARPELRGEIRAEREEADAALEEFLRALTGGGAPERRADIPAAPPAATGMAPGPVCDLDRLPGAGPGLIWALRRAGLTRLSDLVALDERELVARLGPIGRLLPAADWIALARAVG